MGTFGSVPVSNERRILLRADQANTEAVANTLNSITDLTFALLSGVTYYFRFECPYTVTAGTTGTRWTVNGPAFTFLDYDVSYAGTSAVNITTITGNGAYQLPAASTTQGPAGTSTVGIARVYGWVTPSAPGNLALQFASEVAGGGGLTAKKGGFGLLSAVG